MNGLLSLIMGYGNGKPSIINVRGPFQLFSKWRGKRGSGISEQLISDQMGQKVPELGGSVCGGSMKEKKKIELSRQ